MALPLPLMAAIVQAGMSLRAAELETERARINTQLQMHLASLQQEYALARLDAEKEIMLEMLSISKHAFDRKMDFLTQIFTRVHEMVARHQHELIEEQREIRDRLFDDSLSRNDRIRLDARLSDVSVMLIDLTTASRSLGAEFAQMGHSLRPIA